MKNTIMVNNKKMICRVYDNGGVTMDRYTLCFRAYKYYGGYIYPYYTCNSDPFHGIGIYGENENKPIDGKHLGKRIEFEDLPIDVKKLAYIYLGE